MENNLSKLRKEAGLSSQQLGYACGKSRQTIYQLEQPEANPMLKTAYAIAEVLDVEVTEIWPNPFEVVEETVTIRRIAEVPKSRRSRNDKQIN